MNDFNFGSPDANDSIAVIDKMVGDTVRWAQTDLEEMVNEALPRVPGAEVQSRSEQLQAYIDDKYAPDSKERFKAKWETYKARGGNKGGQAAKFVKELYDLEMQERKQQEDEGW